MYCLAYTADDDTESMLSKCPLLRNIVVLFFSLSFVPYFRISFSNSFCLIAILIFLVLTFDSLDHKLEELKQSKNKKEKNKSLQELALFLSPVSKLTL